jgi:microcystin-dependent protein
VADKTIPSLPAITTIDDFSLFIVDTGIETFKLTAANLALFLRDTILPAGAVTPYAGATAPAGWLLCDGAAVSRSTYSRLFTAIGTAFGVGDGSTTFNLPDCRGRVIAGKDNMGGATAGRLTNAVSGIVGTTLGAAGGAETYTPAGTNGGSQSIAHVHAGPSHTHTGPSHTHAHAHTHNIAHVHAFARESSEVIYALITAEHSSVSIGSSVSGDTASFLGQTTKDAGSTRAAFSASVNRYYYTTGVVDTGLSRGSGSSAISGSASPSTTDASGTAATGASGTGNTAGMSANATVNGSNFTFTGTASHRVQPTIIMNTIIKL